VKILIVNSSDIIGGAGRAAYRLHKALLNEGVDSQMLVKTKSGDDFTVTGPDTKIKQAINQMRSTLDDLPLKFYQNPKSAFSVSWLPFSDVIDQINKINPDIVHLHWWNAGMLRIEDLNKIKVPIVWSLHDMWAFTGGCHYSGECRDYEKECGSCTVLESDKVKDLSRKIYNRKHKAFDAIDSMTIVGLSNWLSDCAKSSALLKNKKHINLPNPIDTTVFKPFNKEKARELWNLPKVKKLVLFGAMAATSDLRKGFKELSEAMKKLKSEEIEFVIFGSSEPKEAQNFGFKTHYLGHLHDDISLITLYSAVDVMIVPSLQENLSNAIMESLACGTPVVSFDVGGNSDMIDHKKNGYLVKPFDATDMANGIEWILHYENHNACCKNSREKVVREFDNVVVANKYIKLYYEILN
jgi:glycosyltransferase involved in cell wall biosynthesis